MYLNGVLRLHMFDVISVHLIDVQDTILEKKKKGTGEADYLHAAIPNGSLIWADEFLFLF